MGHATLIVEQLLINKKVQSAKYKFKYIILWLWVEPSYIIYVHIYMLLHLSFLFDFLKLVCYAHV